VGGNDSRRADRVGGDTPGGRDAGAVLNDSELRAHWWAAVASVTRLTGDLATAEDAAQEAFVSALVQWPVEGRPANPRAWLIGVARHKALDRLRRDARRKDKEQAAVREWVEPGPPQPVGPIPDDELALIFMCCHPALDPAARVALTLRSVCGLTTAEVAAVFLVPEPTMAKRLVRTKRKIREAGVPFHTPRPDDLAERLDAVLRVICLVFTEGHKASTGTDLVRGELCDMAVRLARTLVALLPGEPEAVGLLALLLLTDARRAARVDASGQPVLLEEQNRSRWNRAMVEEGEALLEQALRAGRPGPYQLHAAIAACHSTASRPADTDWRQIALLYGELLRYEPTPVVEANRAIAIAMVEGPAVGMAILDAVGRHPQLRRWPQLHIARADLLRRLGRAADARAAYRSALQLDPSHAERTFIARRIDQLES
jgi:RNA polymerase sigma-70 factor, ECF subfamily